MPGIKRKQAPLAENVAAKGIKKSKSNSNDTTKPKVAAIDLETATDSDPIEESDTTEQSGDDDGVSWPSEDSDADVEVTSPTADLPKVGETSTSIIGNNVASDGAGHRKFLTTISKSI